VHKYITENWGTLLSKVLGFAMAIIMAVQTYAGVKPDVQLESVTGAFILVLAGILHWHAVASTVPVTQDGNKDMSGKSSIGNVKS
jgi:hypothetical protein